MTIKLINKIDPATINQLKNWCREQVTISEVDKSSYVNGRLQLWLFNKCNLKTGEITTAYYDDRLHKFSQRVYPGCNIGLLSIHGKFGNVSSSGLIKQHRDHGYAQPTARLVNLGECIFGYDGKQYKVNDGSVIEFNCKKLHSVDKVLTNERFSLVFWQMK